MGGWGKCPKCGYEGHNAVSHWGTNEIECDKCGHDYKRDPDYLRKMKEKQALEEAEQKLKLDKVLQEQMKQPPIDMNILAYRQGLRRSPYSVPPEGLADGVIKLCYDEEGKPVGFNPAQELHALIVGEPGTGKTTIANFLIARQAMNYGVKCWFFVKAEDTEKLIRMHDDIITVDFEENEPVRANLLQNPPNVSKAEWHADLWDMFIQAEAVFDGTKNFLISQSYDLAKEYEKSGIEPSLFELYDFIKGKKFERGSRDSHYQESALNRLEGILKGPLGNFLDCSSGCIEQLVGKSVIFNIGSLPATQQVLIVNALVGWLFLYKRKNECGARHFVIIDDAMLLFDANFERRQDRGMPIINHHLAEVRKTRINMIVSGQFPSLMGQGIFGTSSVKIMFTLSDSNDYERVLDSIGEYDSEKRSFARSISKENREIIVKFSSRYMKPFLGIVPPIEHKKRFLGIFSTYESIDSIVITKEEKLSNLAKNKGIFASIKPRKPYDKEKKEDMVEDKEKEVVGELLKDIYHRPFVTSTARAYYFKFSNEKAKKLYEHVETERLVEPVSLNATGRGGQSKFFCLTAKGCEFIQKPMKPKYSGGKSNTHVFLQDYLAEHLRNKGYKQIEIEKNIEGKKIDLFCVKDEQKIGIEICVSTQKTEHINIKKDKDKCDRLVIVCVDNKEKKKLSERLGDLKNEAEIYALHEFLKEF